MIASQLDDIDSLSLQEHVLMIRSYSSSYLLSETITGNFIPAAILESSFVRIETVAQPARIFIKNEGGFVLPPDSIMTSSIPFQALERVF